MALMNHPRLSRRERESRRDHNSNAAITPANNARIAVNANGEMFRLKQPLRQRPATPKKAAAVKMATAPDKGESFIGKLLCGFNACETIPSVSASEG